MQLVETNKIAHILLVPPSGCYCVPANYATIKKKGVVLTDLWAEIIPFVTSLCHIWHGIL